VPPAVTARGRAGAIASAAPSSASSASAPRWAGDHRGAPIVSSTAASIAGHRVIASEKPEPPPVQSANTSASVAADRMRMVQRSICSMDAIAMRCST